MAKAKPATVIKPAVVAIPKVKVSKKTKKVALKESQS